MRSTFDERETVVVALIGLVRGSTDKQNTQRQHDALDPICLKVFEEKVSGKLNTDDRPALLDALSHIRDGDMLTVQEVDRLGRNLLGGSTQRPKRTLLSPAQVAAWRWLVHSVTAHGSRTTTAVACGRRAA